MSEWSILKSLKDDNRDILGSVIALTGPKELLSELETKMKELYEKVYVFNTHSNCGEFPSTEGYTSKNWENLESNMEDPALFPYMTKCLDCVVEFNDKRLDTLSKLGYSDVEGFLHAPKMGGKVWATVGIIRAHPPNYLNRSKGIIIH